VSETGQAVAVAVAVMVCQGVSIATRDVMEGHFLTVVVIGVGAVVVVAVIPQQEQALL
jgi:hypothetical protein